MCVCVCVLTSLKNILSRAISLPIPCTVRQELMVNDDSPIREYYPVEFQTDLNGKTQEWEAVVLIPFIDEERLLAAMREKSSQLTSEVRREGERGTWV